MDQSKWVSRPEYEWCPECGLNAKIETKEKELGTAWLCLHCGLRGRFGDGFSEPSFEQPPLEDFYEVHNIKE